MRSLLFLTVLGLLAACGVDGPPKPPGAESVSDSASAVAPGL